MFYKCKYVLFLLVIVESEVSLLTKLITLMSSNYPKRDFLVNSLSIPMIETEKFGVTAEIWPQLSHLN